MLARNPWTYGGKTISPTLGIGTGTSFSGSFCHFMTFLACWNQYCSWVPYSCANSRGLASWIWFHRHFKERCRTKSGKLSAHFDFAEQRSRGPEFIELFWTGGKPSRWRTPGRWELIMVIWLTSTPVNWMKLLAGWGYPPLRSNSFSVFLVYFTLLSWLGAFRQKNRWNARG